MAVIGTASFRDLDPGLWRGALDILVTALDESRPPSPPLKRLEIAIGPATERTLGGKT
jgi:hypothetical protein